MDLVMPDVDGAEATRRIKEACPHVQVIALTSYKEDDLVQGALKAGALSYLLKNVTADELAGAIRAAHAGRSDARAGGGRSAHQGGDRAGRSGSGGAHHRGSSRSSG